MSSVQGETPADYDPDSITEVQATKMDPIDWPRQPEWDNRLSTGPSTRLAITPDRVGTLLPLQGCTRLLVWAVERHP